MAARTFSRARNESRALATSLVGAWVGEKLDVRRALRNVWRIAIYYFIAIFSRFIYDSCPPLSPHHSLKKPFISRRVIDPVESRTNFLGVFRFFDSAANRDDDPVICAIAAAHAWADLEIEAQISRKILISPTL